MDKILKAAIFGTVAFMLVMFIAWVFGIDFNERGILQGCSIVVSLMAAIYVVGEVLDA